MRNNNNKGLFKNSLFYIVCFLIVLGVTFFVTSKNGQPQNKELQSSQFVQELKDNKIKSFSIQPENGVYTVSGEYRKAQSVKSNNSGSILFSNTKSETKVSSFKTKVLKNNGTINEITNYAKKNNVKMGA